MSDYYASTAYDSQKYQKIDGREDAIKERWKPHRLNGQGLPWGRSFGLHFLASNYLPSILREFITEHTDEKNFQKSSQLKNYTDSNQQEISHGSYHHDHMVMISKKNLAMVLIFIGTIARMFFIIFPIAVVFLAYSENNWSLLVDTQVLLLGLSLYLISYLCKLSVEKKWIQFKIKAILFRSTGLVYVFPDKGGEASVHPFTEFDAFINNAPNPKTGASYYSLFISHRQNKKLWFSCGSATDDTAIKEKVYIGWEYIQQFMDISKPLPDVPEFEPYRHLDPVTAEWDKQHQRPPKLFENMSDKTYKRLRDKTWEFNKGFIWGQDRRASLVNGWTPPPEEIWTLLTDEELAEVKRE